MRLQREDGIVALEFALILPLFLLIVAGIIEFAVMLFDQQVLTNAGREGARAGIVLAIPKPSVADIQSVVSTYLTGAGLKATSATVNVTGAGLAFGNALTVRVAYPYNFLFLPRFTGGSASMTLTANTTMRHE